MKTLNSQYGHLRSQAAHALLQPAFNALGKIQSGAYEPQDIVNLGMIGTMIKIAKNRRMINATCAEDLISFAKKMGEGLINREFEYAEKDVKELRRKLTTARNELRFVPIEKYDALIKDAYLQVEMKVAMREAGVQRNLFGDEVAN